jgi:DNA-binding CsgD family transcriptional regulator
MKQKPRLIQLAAASLATVSLAATAYFALGMFALFACTYYFGIISLSVLGTGLEHLTYGAGCLAAALGVALSYLFGLLYKRQRRLAKAMLLACYPVAALLAVFAAFASSAAVFFGIFLPFYVLAGLNTGICTRFFYKLGGAGATGGAGTGAASGSTGVVTMPAASGAAPRAGKLLGLSFCIGLAACYILFFIVPLDSTVLVPLAAACIALTLLAMLYVAAYKLDLPTLMDASTPPAANSGARRRFLFVLCSVSGAIAIMSFMIGVNDIAVYSTLLDKVQPGQTGRVTFFPLLFLLGLAAAGLLTDIRHGKYLPIATLGCVFLIAPLVLLLNNPTAYAAFSWLTDFTGGFFLIYIMMSITTIAHRGRHPEFVVPLAGFLFFLFSGIGALSAKFFLEVDVFVSLTVYMALALCLLMAFLSSGGLRAVSLADPEPELPPIEGKPTLAEKLAAYGITEREADTLRLLLANKGTAEIAAEMFVTEGTVYKYISAMITKTDAKNRMGLVAKFATAQPHHYPNPDSEPHLGSDSEPSSEPPLNPDDPS